MSLSDMLAARQQAEREKHEHAGPLLKMRCGLYSPATDHELTCPACVALANAAAPSAPGEAVAAQAGCVTCRYARQCVNGRCYLHPRNDG